LVQELQHIVQVISWSLGGFAPPREARSWTYCWVPPGNYLRQCGNNIGRDEIDCHGVAGFSMVVTAGLSMEDADNPECFLQRFTEPFVCVWGITSMVLLSRNKKKLSRGTVALSMYKRLQQQMKLMQWKYFPLTWLWKMLMSIFFCFCCQSPCCSRERQGCVTSLTRLWDDWWGLSSYADIICAVNAWFGWFR